MKKRVKFKSVQYVKIFCKLKPPQDIQKSKIVKESLIDYASRICSTPPPTVSPPSLLSQEKKQLLPVKKKSKSPVTKKKIKKSPIKIKKS